MTVQDTNQTEPATETATGIVLTDAASSKVKHLLDQEGRDDLALRVAVQPGGCSGLRYQLFFDERTLDGDQFTDFSGVKVVVDRMSVPYLSGAVIDFVDTIEEAGLHDRQPQRDGQLRLRRQLPLSPRRQKARCWTQRAFVVLGIRCRRGPYRR